MWSSGYNFFCEITQISIWEGIRWYTTEIFGRALFIYWRNVWSFIISYSCIRTFYCLGFIRKAETVFTDRGSRTVLCWPASYGVKGKDSLVSFLLLFFVSYLLSYIMKQLNYSLYIYIHIEYIYSVIYSIL